METPDQGAHPDDVRLADLLADLTDEDAERSEPPADLWAAIASRVADDASGHDAPPVVLSMTDRRRPSVSRLPWLAAAAVAAIVAGGGAIWAAVRDTPADTLPSERLLATAELDQLEPLGSTRASARLVDEGGRRHLVIDAQNMAAPPEGSEYEVWLIDPEVTDPRSLGTVSGSDDIVIPSSIDPAKYPIVDISLEPRDGDHQHSGHSLMRGTLQ